MELLTNIESEISSMTPDLTGRERAAFYQSEEINHESKAIKALGSMSC